MTEHEFDMGADLNGMNKANLLAYAEQLRERCATAEKDLESLVEVSSLDLDEDLSVLGIEQLTKRFSAFKSKVERDEKSSATAQEAFDAVSVALATKAAKSYPDGKFQIAGDMYRIEAIPGVKGAFRLAKQSGRKSTR